MSTGWRSCLRQLINMAMQGSLAIRTFQELTAYGDREAPNLFRWSALPSDIQPADWPAGRRGVGPLPADRNIAGRLSIRLPRRGSVAGAVCTVVSLPKASDFPCEVDGLELVGASSRHPVRLNLAGNPSRAHERDLAGDSTTQARLPGLNS